MTPVSRNTEAIQKESNANRVINNELLENSKQSLGTLNIGKSRVQAADQMSTRHIPLTGYDNFHRELQTYPVSRDPMTVQPTGVGNVSSSAILDLPMLIQTCLHLCCRIQVPIMIISIITKYIRRK